MSEGHSANVSHAVVGVVAPGARSIKDVRVYSSGSIQHAESESVARALSDLSARIADSDLPAAQRASAQSELDLVMRTLEQPDSEERRGGIRFHLGRIADAVRGSQPLLDAANSTAQLLGVVL